MAAAPPSFGSITVPPALGFGAVNLALGSLSARVANLEKTTTSSGTTSTLQGTTSGAIQYVNNALATFGSIFLAYLNAYENTTTAAQVITFDTPFTVTPLLLHDDSGGATVSATGLTLPASMVSPVTGWIVIVGF